MMKLGGRRMARLSKPPGIGGFVTRGRGARRAKDAGFLVNRAGSTAVEFALVAPIFLALVFSIMEAGWYFFVSNAVDRASANAAHLIRTGQAQSSDMSRDAFFDEICNVVDTFGSCEKNLTVDVASFSSFDLLAADLSDPQCRNRDDPSIEGAQFDEADYGGQREIIRVRVCFLYKPVNPGIGLNRGHTAHGERKMIAVNIFRNEPFGGAPNG